MTEAPGYMRWVTWAGCVLVVAVLYWTQAILVPLCIAVLLTFVLAPPVTFLQRYIGRAAAISTIVVLTFVVLGGAGWAVAQELSELAQSLPSYRTNIREKVVDVQRMSTGGSVEKVQQTLEEIQEDIKNTSAANKGRSGDPVVVASEQVESLWGFPAWLGPLIEPLSTASLVLVMVIFMLKEREDLRDRLIHVIGAGHVTLTTRAIDEAGTRVSRYLLMQTLVNLTYGIAVAVGLHLFGVPHAMLWGSLGAVLRFIPYVGPLVAAGAPILVSLAALPGWERPLYVIGFFVALEVFTNMVLETLLYAGAAGVSQVALLVAVAFWTWLWGPVGLLLATPLTVCLVVIGKHVPGLTFVATLMADLPALDRNVRYYQRILARDQSEAAELIEAHVQEHEPKTVFDALMLPALNAAERDRIDGLLSSAEESAVIDSTRELLEDAALLIAKQHEPAAAAGGDAALESEPAKPPVTVLAYPVGGEGDVLALRMLQQLLDRRSFAMEIVSHRLLASELVDHVRQHTAQIICLADLPPSSASKTRYLVRRLRAALPTLKIVVGRWAPAEFADDSAAGIRDAGADAVGATLQETREHLRVSSLTAVGS